MHNKVGTSVAVTLAALAALLVHPGSSGAESPGDAPASTVGLRERLLGGSASDFSIEPVSGVWGVLFETGYPEGTATLVALADGSASLYLSTGGGVIGGASHPSINAAARRAIEVAVVSQSEFEAAATSPLPDPGRVRFVLLTAGGVVAAEESEEVLGAGQHALSQLFFAAHDVITGLRVMSEKDSD